METAATNAVDTGAIASETTQVTDSAPVTDETAQAPQVQKAEPTQDKEPEWFVKRMGELTARYRSEERERQAIAQERDQLRQQLQQQQVKEPEKAKTLEDFGYDESKYQAYLFDKAEQRAVEAAKRVRIEEQTQAQKERTVRKFKEREVEFEKANPDYRDLAYSAPINDQVAALVMELETGPEIAHYLGKNKSIALSLNDLPPHIAAIELGRIDARLSSEKAQKAAALEAAKAAKAVSKAPDPASTLEASGEPSTIKPDEADADKLSDAEWTRRRNKQLARKKG
jgi:hypothetical protein